VRLVGGVIDQRELDELIVQEDVVVFNAQLNAATGSHDEGSLFLVGLAGIVGDCSNNLVVVA